MLLSDVVQPVNTNMAPYYLFAGFVFVLVCLVMLLWRFLFAGLKRERMEFERKESELKNLLKALRKEADDFFDMASDKSAEISDERKRVAALVAGFALPHPEEAKSTKQQEYREAKVIPFHEFQKAIDEAAKKQNSPIEVPAEVEEVKPEIIVKPAGLTRRERIMAMKDSGKDAAQISREMGITRSEVDLVIKTGRS